MFETFIALIAVAAILSYINKKILKLPDTIGIMILAILSAVIFSAIALVQKEIPQSFCSVIDGLDFRSFVLDFLLGFLLFAGAIHVDIKQLTKDKTPIFFLCYYWCSHLYFFYRYSFLLFCTFGWLRDEL